MPGEDRPSCSGPSDGPPAGLRACPPVAEFKDLFSRDSAAYAAYRPRYPADLFAWLAQAAPGRLLAWDAGTGNGQAAVALAQHFDHVVGTDPSEQQLSQAVAHPKVEYRRAAEEAGLSEASVDLVTTAQALHWFDRPRFWAEARRVLQPGGILAVWCYELQRVSLEIDRLIDRFYHQTVGPWWTPDRKLVEQGYRTIEFPFEEITPPEFTMSAEWTLEQQLGYLGTWSAVNRMGQATGRDPVEEVRPALQELWGEAKRLVLWPLSVRAGRRP